VTGDERRETSRVTSSTAPCCRLVAATGIRVGVYRLDWYRLRGNRLLLCLNTPNNKTGCVPAIELTPCSRNIAIVQAPAASAVGERSSMKARKKVAPGRGGDHDVG